MRTNNLKAIFLSGTIALSLSSVSMVDNSFIKPNSQSKFECMKSSSNDYESLGDSNSDIYRGTDIYSYKNNGNGIIERSLDLFGDMRNLTEDEQQSCMQGLADISEATGVSLF